MPEGHTLRRLALDLDAAFGRDPLRVGSPQGRFADEAALLDGEPMLAAESAGKHLFLAFPDDRFVHIHLGLIGAFDIAPLEPGEEVPAPRGAVRLRLVGPRAVADLRGATQCALIAGERRDAVVAGLGPDPLRPDADPERAWTRIRTSKRSIGELLMDQTIVAGVGNVYRAEVLFRQRLDPFRPGTSLRRGQWQAIWDDLVELMADGVRVNRIDTVRAEHTPEAMGREARVDDHGGEVYVYRRTGQSCFVCGAAVRTESMASRNLFWCPRCQRRWRPRTVG